jgi:hypothetical protein
VIQAEGTHQARPAAQGQQQQEHAGSKRKQANQQCQADPKQITRKGQQQDKGRKTGDRRELGSPKKVNRASSTRPAVQGQQQKEHAGSNRKQATGPGRPRASNSEAAAEGRRTAVKQNLSAQRFGMGLGILAARAQTPPRPWEAEQNNKKPLASPSPTVACGSQQGCPLEVPSLRASRGPPEAGGRYLTQG